MLIVCNAAKQLVLDSDLPTAKKFLAYRVAELVNDSHDHDFWMNSQSLADELGLDAGTVRKYLRSMVDAGLMVVTEQGGGRWKTTRYKFTGCAAMHKPRPQARNDQTAPPVPETAPPMPETAPLIRDTAPGGAAYKENNKEPEVTTTEGPKSDQPSPEPADSVANEITEFETWWEHVPRRVGKGQARTAYRAARKKLSADELVAAADLWAASVAGSDPQFVPHPSTWLNGERWTDDDPPATPADNQPDPTPGPGPLQPAIHEPDLTPADPAGSADAIRRLREKIAS